MNILPLDILKQAASQARGLSIDAIHACSSGHLGLPLGAAELGAVVLDSESDTHGTQDTSATSVHRDSTNPTLDCR